MGFKKMAEDALRVVRVIQKRTARGTTSHDTNAPYAAVSFSHSERSPYKTKSFGVTTSGENRI